MERRPYTNANEQAAEINLRISSLKAELIGLTQQRDRLLGNPVATRMQVTVDVLPSSFSSPQQEQQPQAPLTQSLQQSVGARIGEDPRFIRRDKRAYNLSRDIR
jgi:hypothetical protein